MLSILGFLNGITSMGIVVFSLIIGSISLYEAKKYKVRLLTLAGLTFIFVGFLWLGPTADFFSLLITGKNLNPIYLYAILSYMWIGPAIISGMYFGAELILPEKKWYLVGFYVILAVIFEFFLWFDTTNVFNFTLNNPGQDLIDCNYKSTHLNYYFIILMLISAFIFLVIGFLIKAFKTSGLIRKKSIYLSIGFAIFILTAIFDSLFAPGAVLFMIRLGMMSSPLWMYLGIREEPEKKVTVQKEIKIESDLFRISRTRPEKITEEEVSISKEKKICLVCKGKVSRAVYICPKCDALYCNNCSQALSNLENACWVCNTPFDESKPVKPYKKESNNKVVKEKYQNNSEAKKGELK
ncbi:MAG: hypothetical protein ACFFDK_09975 [Promethearchaeota archaeon]